MWRMRESKNTTSVNPTALCEKDSGVEIRAHGPETMEESTLILPMVPDTIIGLGDLWDCSACLSPGNIFSEPFEAHHLEAFPMQSLTYVLRQTKHTRDKMTALNVSASVALELMNGKIKVEGSAKYDNEETDNFNEESLTCTYDCNTFVVRLRQSEDIQKIVNQSLKTKLVQEKLRATHYVQSVRLGGHVDAEIKYSHKVDKSHMNVEGTFKGSINMGSITASAEASLKLLDTEFKEDLNVSVSVNASPRFEKAPTSVEEMFKGVSEIDKKLKEEAHFPQLGNHVVGVPLTFKLVPLNHLFDDYKPGGLTKILEDDIMDNFTTMIYTCQDFIKPNHIKALLVEKDYRLVTILKDEFNPFTHEVTRQENEYHKLAVDFKARAFAVYSSYKDGSAGGGVEEIQTVLTAFEVDFDLPGLVLHIQIMVQEGRKELSGVHSGDVVNLRDEDDRPTVLFFSNVPDRDDWWVPERELKVHLQTKLGQASPSGTFLRLFNLSGPLSKLGVSVGVSFPNISADFSLTFKIVDKVVKYEKEDIPFALEVLAVAIAEGDCTSMLFYRLTSVLQGLDLHSVSSLLPDITSLVNIFKESRGILVCETYPQLLEALLGTTSVWNLVVPLQALHTAFEAMQFFRQLRHILPEEHPRIVYRFIVPRFNIVAHHDAPLLLAFRDESLKAVCLDRLDLLLLLQGFEASPKSPDLTLLDHISMRKHCLYPARANFAIKVMEGLVLDHGTDLTNLIPPIPNFQPLLESEQGAGEELGRVMSVVRAAAMRVEVEILNTVGWLAIADLPTLRTKLEKFGWTDDGFLASKLPDWEKLFIALQRFLGDQAAYLIKVEGAINSLLLIEKPKSPEESDDEEIIEARHVIVREVPVDDRLDQVKAIIRFVTEFVEDPDDPPSQMRLPRTYRSRGRLISEDEIFKNLKAEIDTFIKCSDVEVIIRGIVNAMDAFYNDEVQGSTEFFNLLQLIPLVEGLASEDASFSQVLFDVVKRYCERTELLVEVYPKYPGGLKKVQESIAERNLFRTLGLLSKFRQDPLIYILTEDLYDLKTLSNAEQTKRIVENMRKAGFTPDQLKEVWLNPKFQALIREGMDNEGLVETIFIQLCVPDPTDEDEGILQPPTIPRFIPKDIAEKLKPLVYNIKEPQFGWGREWRDVEDAVQAFQIFVTRDYLPGEFPAALWKNIHENAQLKSKFKECGALFYWDEDERYFRKPWSLHTVSKAISLLMHPEVSEDGMSEPAQTEPRIPKDTNMSLLPAPVIEKWKRFAVGGHVDLISSSSSLLSRIQSFRPISPYVEYDELNKTLAKILPFLVLENERRNPTCLQSSYAVNYIKYPPTDGVRLPGHIEFETPGPRDGSGVRFLLSRGDLLTALFNCSDASVTHKLLLSMMSSPMALPLVVPGILQTSDVTIIEGFKFVIPALQNLVVRELDGVVPQPHLLKEPFRFVLTLRVGEAKDKLGRSSILNQLLMAHKNFFSCFAEPGAEHGPPVSRPGLVEFTWLSTSTVTPDFYQNVGRSHYEQSTQPDLVLLGVLHGDALSLGPLLESLKTFTSAFVVFWKVNSWNELKAKKTQLGKHIGIGNSTLDLVLYPDSSLEGRVGPQNIIGMASPQEIEASRAKLHSVFRTAIASKPKMVVPLQSHSDSSVVGPARSRAISTKPQVTPSTTKLPQVDQETISCRESLALLNFIRDTTVQRIKESLIAKTECVLLDQLALLTSTLLALPLDHRNKALTHLEYELDFLSSMSSRSAVERVVKLRQEMAVTVLDEDAVKKLQEEIKAVLVRLQSTTLTIHDIFRHLLTTPFLTDEKYFEFISSGFAIELFQPTYGDVMWKPAITSAFRAIPPDTRVFVVSAIGLKAAGKSTLLNRLFGHEFREGRAGCTNGLHMRFLWIADELRKELKCDAFVVIDSEGFGAAENCIDEFADAHERNMAAFVVGISHLSIVNVLGNSMLELKAILESSFLTMSRVSDVPLTPDMLLVQQQLADEPDEPEFYQEWQDFTTNVNDLCREHELVLGVRVQAAYRMETMRAREKHNELVHIIRSLRKSQEHNALEYHRDVEGLMQRILTLCQTSHQIMKWGDWYDGTRNYWTAIICNSRIQGSGARQTLDAISLKLSQVQVQAAIHTAFRTHDSKSIEPNFLLSMKEWFDPDPSAQVKDPGLALDTVHSELRKVINTCDVNGGGPCIECASAFSSREALFEASAGKRRQFLTTDAISMHTAKVRESIWRKYQQIVTALQILHGRSKSLALVLDKFLAEGQSDAWLKFKQHVSTLVLVTPAALRIEEEVSEAYSSLPHIQQRFPQSLPDLESIPAFDLGYYNRALESSVNSPKRDTLTWVQKDWLIARIEDIPVDLLLANDVKNYLVGMVSEVKERVEVLLEDFEDFCEERLLPNFKWEAHLYAMQTLRAFMENKEDEWEADYDPLVQLEKRRIDFPNIFEEQDLP